MSRPNTVSSPGRLLSILNPKETWTKRLPVLLLLIVIYLAGVWVRTESFHSRGHRHEDPFWVESAQHFRNVRMVAEGGTIPRVDIDLEYPEGLKTRTHTIHGEYAIGLLARVVPLEKISWFCRSHALFGIYLDKLLQPFWPVSTPDLGSFVRYTVRWFACLQVFWLYLITHEITGRRAAALGAALLYAFSFGSIARTLGDTFYHEHVALPLLGGHLWFFYRSLKRQSLWNPVLCALFLLGSLLTWKVIEFYFLVLVLYFFWMTLGPGLDRNSFRTLWIMTLTVALAGLFLDVHLKYNHFILSKGMLGAYSVLITYGLTRWKSERWRWSVVGMVLILAFLRSRLPSDSELYGHVWQTFFYRFRYLQKPLDPSLLPFDVRHYWVPPYVSPNLFAFLNEVFWPIALAVPGVFAFAVYLLLPGPWRNGTWTPERRQKAFLFLGFWAFLAFYLMFYKIKTFLILFTLPWAGILLVKGTGQSLRLGTALALAVCFGILGVLLMGYADLFIGLAVVSVLGGIGLVMVKYRRAVPQIAALGLLVLFAVISQGYQTVAWNRSVLARGMVAIGISPSQEKDTGAVVPGYLIHETLDWIKYHSEQRAVFMCEFVLAPSILEYTRRPINQHCFFESAMRLKYEEFCYALFKTEEEFYEFCRKYQSTYFIYNAHMLLRDDPNMSFRYIADQMDWNRDWVIYQFHFHPESLRHFELVHQNPFMRIYRVLQPEQLPRPGKNQNEPDYSPMFDESLFRRMIGQAGQEGRRSPEFLYPLVKAYELYYQAENYLLSDQPAVYERGLAYLAEAVQGCPWATPLSNRLGQVFLSIGRSDLARKAFLNTLTWKPDDPEARLGIQRTGSVAGQNE